MLLNGGVADVEAVSEDEAVTAVTQGLDAGTAAHRRRRFASARGAAKSVGERCPGGQLTRSARRRRWRRSIPPVRNPDGARQPVRRGDAAGAGGSVRPGDPDGAGRAVRRTNGVDGAVGPQLAYSVDDTDGSYGTAPTMCLQRCRWRRSAI